jgi:hypothetical protein
MRNHGIPSAEILILKMERSTPLENSMVNNFPIRSSLHTSKEEKLE